MEKFGLTVRLNDILRLEGQLFLKAEHFEVTEIGLNGKLAKVTDQKTQLPPPIIQQQLSQKSSNSNSAKDEFETKTPQQNPRFVLTNSSTSRLFSVLKRFAKSKIDFCTLRSFSCSFFFIREIFKKAMRHENPFEELQKLLDESILSKLENLGSEENSSTTKIEIGNLLIINQFVQKFLV